MYYAPFTYTNFLDFDNIPYLFDTSITSFTDVSTEIFRGKCTIFMRFWTHQNKVQYPRF